MQRTAIQCTIALARRNLVSSYEKCFYNFSSLCFSTTIGIPADPSYQIIHKNTQIFFSPFFFFRFSGFYFIIFALVPVCLSGWSPGSVKCCWPHHFPAISIRYKFNYGHVAWLHLLVRLRLWNKARPGSWMPESIHTHNYIYLYYM